MIYFTKTPSERVPLTLDFTEALPTNEALTISGSTIMAANSSGLDVTSLLLDDVTISSSYATVTLIEDVEADPGPPAVVPLGEGEFTIRFLLVTTPSAFLIEEVVMLTIAEKS